MRTSCLMPRLIQLPRHCHGHRIHPYRDELSVHSVEVSPGGLDPFGRVYRSRITAICKTGRLYAKIRETITFPLYISLKSTITYNFIKILLILKINNLN
jgi:hypothetical protein